MNYLYIVHHTHPCCYTCTEKYYMKVYTCLWGKKGKKTLFLKVLTKIDEQKAQHTYIYSKALLQPWDLVTTAGAFNSI